jgi:hypothetical protein
MGEALVNFCSGRDRLLYQKATAVKQLLNDAKCIPCAGLITIMIGDIKADGRFHALCIIWDAKQVQRCTNISTQKQKREISCISSFRVGNTEQLEGPSVLAKLRAVVFSLGNAYHGCARRHLWVFLLDFPIYLQSVFTYSMV